MTQKVRDALLGVLVLALPAMTVLTWHFFFPTPPYNRGVLQYAKATFSDCVQLPELERSVKCDAFVKYWESCRKADDGCHIAETHKMLTWLDFDPPSLHIDTSGLKPLKE
jgi:hypothetical protein